MSDLEDQQAAMLIATTTVSPLLEETSEDFSVVFTSSWQRRWSNVEDDFHAILEEALDLTPSPRQAHLHVQWLEAITILDTSVTMMGSAMQVLDVDTMDEAVDMLDDVTAISDELFADIEDFEDDPNVVLEVARGIDTPVEDCDVFRTFQIAQVYYAEHPEEQSVLDVDRDGRACDREFDRVADLDRRVPKVAAVTPTPESTNTPTAVSTKVPQTVEPSNPSATPTGGDVIGESNVIEMAGRGEQIERFSISEDGSYLVTLTVPESNGDSVLISIRDLSNETVEDSSLAGWEPGDSQTVVAISAGEYFLKVETSGDWIVTIEPLT